MPQDIDDIRKFIFDQLRQELYYDDNGQPYTGGDDEALGIGQNVGIVFIKGDNEVYNFVPRKQTSVGDLMNNHSTNSESLGVDYLEALGQAVRSQIDQTVSDESLQLRLNVEETIEEEIADQIGTKVDVLTNENIRDYLLDTGADHIISSFPEDRTYSGYYRQVDRETGEIKVYDLRDQQSREDLLNTEGIVLGKFDNGQLAIFDLNQVDLSEDEPNYQLKMEAFFQTVGSTAKQPQIEEEKEVVDPRPQQGSGQAGLQIPEGTRWVSSARALNLRNNVEFFKSLGINVNSRYCMAIYYSVNFRPEDHNATDKFESLVFVQDNRGQTQAVYSDPDGQWHKLDESQLSDLLGRPCYETAFSSNSPTRYNQSSLSGQLRNVQLDSGNLDSVLLTHLQDFKESTRIY